MTNAEIGALKDTFKGKTGQVKIGNTVASIGADDLQFSESTSRWRLKSTGNSISN